MTWNRKDAFYLHKFRLNIYQKIGGIPSGFWIPSQQISPRHHEELSVCSLLILWSQLSGNFPHGHFQDVILWSLQRQRLQHADPPICWQGWQIQICSDRNPGHFCAVISSMEYLQKFWQTLYFFFMEVCRATEPVFTWNTMASSTCWSSQLRLWGKLPTPLHNPKSAVLFWLSKWRERLHWNYPTSHSLNPCSSVTQKLYSRWLPGMIPLDFACSTEPESWRSLPYLLLPTGIGILDFSTLQICGQDLEPPGED